MMFMHVIAFSFASPSVSLPRKRESRAGDGAVALMEWTAPDGIESARLRSLWISNEEAVRETA